jgi:hypothetical protein
MVMRGLRLFTRSLVNVLTISIEQELTKNKLLQKHKTNKKIIHERKRNKRNQRYPQ